MLLLLLNLQPLLLLKLLVLLQLVLQLLQRWLVLVVLEVLRALCRRLPNPSLLFDRRSSSKDPNGVSSN